MKAAPETGMKVNSSSFLLAASMLVSSLVLGGCGADAGLEAKSAHDAGKGTVRVQDASYDQAWAAAHAAVRWNPAGAIQDHAEEHYLITDPSAFDQVGVWFEPLGADKTRVTVVVIDVERLPGPNEDAVQKDIASAIALLKAGQPVDKRP